MKYQRAVQSLVIAIAILLLVKATGLAQELPLRPIELQGDDSEIFGQEVRVNSLMIWQGDDTIRFDSNGFPVLGPLTALQGDDREVYGRDFIRNPLISLQGDDLETFGDDGAVTGIGTSLLPPEPTIVEFVPVEIALSESLPVPDAGSLASLSNSVGTFGLADTESSDWREVAVDNIFLKIGRVLALLLVSAGISLFIMGDRPIRDT